MSYINSILMSGEHVVYRSKKHWVIFFFPTLIFLLVMMVTVDGSVGNFLARWPQTSIRVFWGILPLLLAFINFKTSEFGITNKRVVAKIGFIRRSSLEVLLTKVEGIQVDQSIPARMLGYGTIEIAGTGGTKNPFSTIEAPFDFRKAVPGSDLH